MIRTCSLLTVCLLAAATHAQEDRFAIRGRVVDAAAKPVAGARVRLLAPAFNGFEVDEKTATDADGRFSVAASKSWTRMDPAQRQELSVLAMAGDRLAVMQFSRNSAPPKSEVLLTLSSAGGAKIEVLAPDLRPVAGAKVKIAGLMGDTIRVDFTEAELAQLGSTVKKTSFGYLIGKGLVGLPADLEMEIGQTDARGLVTAAKLAPASIGAITVRADEFGEQTLSHYWYQGVTASDWPHRLVLKKTGRLVGQLTSPLAGTAAQREVTLTSYEHNQATGMIHGSHAKVVTDREGKFDVPRMAAGTVSFAVKFDPAQPMRPLQATTNTLQLKANETLHLKIDLRVAVRVEGRVLDAESRKPIRDIQVRAYLGMGFESTTSDAQGKFFFCMPPGQTAFHPDIPEEYLPPLRPSDYLDPANPRVTIFKVPEGKNFEAPPILLYRQATLRGVVVDDQGRPLPGMGVSGISMAFERRTGQAEPREVTAEVNERGEFAIAGIDPREAIRLRVTGKDVAKVVTIAKPGSEVVRIVIAANERFTISGRVTDAEGKPIADAVLEIWHRAWRLAPNVAEPKKLNEPIRADAQGRFKTAPLAADGYYRFTIRAAGAKTTESAWLDATQPATGQPQQLVVTRFGGVSGLLRDRGGKPIADALVFLFSSETRMETTSNSKGEFKLDAPAGKPFCVVVRHADFRVDGSYYEKTPSSLDRTMVRLTEPGEKMAPRRLLTGDERDKMLKRLVEPLKEKLEKSTNTQEKVQSLQSLTGVAPELVTEFLDKHPLKPTMYNEMLLTQVAMKRASVHPEEAEELIGRLTQGAQQSMAYGMLVDALPETARARKLELLAEALVGARAEKSPEFRAVSMGQVAKRLWVLGAKDRATSLLREAEKIAGGLSTSAFAGFARASFATDLALIDLPAALALMKGLKDRHEFARHHGNTAHRIAGTQPAAAVKILDLIPPPQQNEFNQRDHYAIRVAYRMSQADLPAALKLASSISDAPSRAYTLGVIAQGVAKTDSKQASDLLRRAFALLEEDVARPDPPRLTSPLSAGSVAAALLLVAEQTDATMIRECLWRSTLLQRPPTENPEQVWRYAAGNNALAMAAARYDGKLAALLLPSGTAQVGSREGQLAGFLVDPLRALESALKARDNRELVQLIAYVATPDDQLPRLILRTLGIWRIDIEDIDF